MIERLIYTALKEGLVTFQKNENFLEDLFVTQYGLSSTEFEAIRTHFRAKPPNVIHGYAHADAKFPLYSIVLGAEGEAVNFIGDDAGMVPMDDPDDPGADIRSAIWDHSHDIFVYTEHPDVTLYYYEIAKAILLASQEYFLHNGVFGQRFSGMDMAPDPRYVPENLFLRRLTFKSQTEFQTLVDVNRAFKISGIAVDSSGSPSDVGGVKTNVKPYGNLEGNE